MSSVGLPNDSTKDGRIYSGPPKFRGVCRHCGAQRNRHGGPAERVSMSEVKLPGHFSRLKLAEAQASHGSAADLVGQSRP